VSLSALASTFNEKPVILVELMESNGISAASHGTSTRPVKSGRAGLCGASRLFGGEAGRRVLCPADLAMPCCTPGCFPMIGGKNEFSSGHHQ
jgi:hypothetical protein